MQELVLPGAWASFLGNPEKEAWWRNLVNWYGNEVALNEVYPPVERVFEALKLVGPNQTNVVILGQDPYHGKGQAHGLSFSVPQGIKVPPSLANIQKELIRSIGKDRPGVCPPHDLTSWARQGVLLLNTVLSVRANEPFSHRDKGWENLSKLIIENLGKNKKGIAFLLWGNPSREFLPLISKSSHLVLESSHPSPLSAYRGFLGCDHFRLVNDWLEKNERPPIDWLAGHGLF